MPSHTSQGIVSRTPRQARWTMADRTANQPTIGCRVQLTSRESIEYGVCGEVVIWVVVRDEDCLYRQRCLLLDPCYDSLCVRHKKGGVNQRSGLCTNDQSGDTRQAFLGRGQDVSLQTHLQGAGYDENTNLK